MPSPTSTAATLRPELRTFYEAAYADIQTDFIGPRVFPVMNVAKASGTFGKREIEDLLKHGASGERTPGGGYDRDVTQFTTDSYTTKEYGFEEKVDDAESAMYSSYDDMEMAATARATNKLLTRSEMRIAAMFDSTAYTNASMVQSKSNGTWVAGNPITDVEGAVQLVYNATGVRPNALIINWKVFRQLRLNSQIQAAIESAGAGSSRLAADVTIDLLSAAFNLEVMVAGASKNTAGVGAAASIAQVWPNHAIVATVAKTNDIQEPCVGRQFHWSEDGSQIAGVVETYREESVRAEIVRIRHQVAEKQLYLQLAAMVLSVI